MGRQSNWSRFPLRIIQTSLFLSLVNVSIPDTKLVSRGIQQVKLEIINSDMMDDSRASLEAQPV